MINRDRLVTTFLELVKIDSPSGKEKVFAGEVSKRLEALGARVEIDDIGNVIAQFDGKGEAVMFNAHLDTVEPGQGIKPVVKGDMITSDGTTILGGDCKAGIALIMEAITSTLEDKKPHVPLDVFFSVQEELGLVGSKHLDIGKLRARKGFVFDAGEEANEICLSAPFYNRMDVEIIGRAAHAGAEPEKGISAIRIASEIIASLPLGRIDEKTTANVGVIKGGSVRNAVSENAVFEGEIRSRSQERLDEITNTWKEALNDARKRYPEAKVVLYCEREMDGYVFARGDPLVTRASKALEREGLSPHFIDSGGGTDANVLNTKGVNCIGLAHAVWESHTTREYVKISELVKIAKLAEALMADI